MCGWAQHSLRKKNLVGGSVYGFEWGTKPETQKGTTGTCTIRYSNNAAREPGCVRRNHLCAFNPCSAQHSLSKYNFARSLVLLVDMHLQQVPTPDVLPAVAVAVLPPLPHPDEPPLDLVEVVAPPLPPRSPPVEPPPDLVELLAALAGEPSLPVRPPSPEPPPSAELLPVAEPLTIGLPEVQLDDLFELPDLPAFGVLAGVKPAAPAPPLDLIDDVEVIAPAVAVRAVVGTIEAARHKICLLYTSPSPRD